MPVKLYTIGFTKKSAERFFTLLQQHGVARLIDIRRHPEGQLAGFAKQGDLTYFLKELAGCDYYHLLELAPTDELLRPYQKSHDWPAYERGFAALMEARRIPHALDRDLFTTASCCLLCSEATPEQCHRRLVAERLAVAWPELEIAHLV
ncbi:MAG: DUF488 family protein [Candidatus Saccharimonadales bacterium]